MVQIYIKHTDDNYYLLDLEPNEAINFKLTVKDLNDITKIFSPFTQSFKIKATDKNKMLCGFVGNEKILRVNNNGEFDSLIYISGFLFQSGKLTFEESAYELQDQKEFSTTFASTVSGLVELLGDSTIQDLFDLNDPAIKTVWDVHAMKRLMTSAFNGTLANGINIKTGIPFISNIRVWNYDDNLALVDNIKFNSTRSDLTENFIKLSEIRPAINYLSIMQSLILKYNLNVICPILEKPEITDLMVWCNSESLVVPDAVTYPLINYEALNYLRYDVNNDPGGHGIPESPKWEITLDQLTGIFKAKRLATSRPQNWSDGFDINLKFNGLVSKDSNSTKIKVVLKRTTDGNILDSQVIEGVDLYTVRIKDTQLDINGELYFRYEILPETLVDWTNIEAKIIQKYRYEYKYYTVKSVERATFSYSSLNNTASTDLGGNKINLITCLPKMKCIDFLRSFFKTFNISILSTGLNDQSMYWVTPSDIQESNKPYSKRIVDYTNFVDIATHTKKKANQYNQYSFSHFASKYYEAVYGDGTKFGALDYPTLPPTKPTKFEVKTDYSILKQSSTFDNQYTATCLGFAKDTPTIQDNGANRYKPVYEEFTLFYLKAKNLQLSTLSIEASATVNAELFGVLEANFVNYTNGKTLAFGAENENTYSLYLNYYKSFIELLLNPNTYQSSFTLTLPPNEIFLNFANLNQGESNIPTGFRAQNEIIIGEQRYNLVDSGIDLTTGKTKLNVLNF